MRIVDVREHEWAAWTAFVANWLTYFNSAGNWVLYAALNRDLRSIIKLVFPGGGHPYSQSKLLLSLEDFNNLSSLGGGGPWGFTPIYVV